MTDLETRVRDAFADIADAVPVSATAWSDSRRRGAGRVTRRRVRFGLSVGAVVAGTAVIVVGAFLLSGNGSTGSPTELTQSTELQLTPMHPLSSGKLDEAARILRQRVDALHIDHATIATNAGSLTVTVPKRLVPTLTAAASTRGVLQFRQAMAIANGKPTRPAPHHRRPLPVEDPKVSKGLQKSFGRYNCKQDPAPNGDDPVVSDYLIACSADQTVKYLLAPAPISNRGVSSASAANDSATDSWVVDLTFTRAASRPWQQLTERAYEVNNGQAQTTACQPPTGCNSVGFLLDGTVESAPYISQAGGISGGQAQIAGNLTRESATQLGAVLNSQPLPAAFAVTEPSH